jgi:FAD synthase
MFELRKRLAAATGAKVDQIVFEYPSSISSNPPEPYVTEVYVTGLQQTRVLLGTLRYGIFISP